MSAETRKTAGFADQWVCMLVVAAGELKLTLPTCESRGVHRLSFEAIDCRDVLALKWPYLRP